MPDSNPTIADELRRKMNFQLAMNALCILALVIGGWYFATQASESHAALCNLRADQVQRVRSSEEFLDKNPQGIPGISRAQIEQGLRNSRRTIQSLDSLGCPPVESLP